jgi:hypothetical protein
MYSPAFPTYRLMLVEDVTPLLNVYAIAYHEPFVVVTEEFLAGLSDTPDESDPNVKTFVVELWNNLCVSSPVLVHLL